MADHTIARELARTYGVDRDLPCPRCGYNLRGNAGGRCPECGKNVEAFLKKASMGMERRRTIHVADVRERIAAYIGPSFTMFLAAGFWAAVRVSNAPLWLDRFVAGAMVLMVVAGAAAWHYQTRRMWRRMGLAHRAARIVVAWAPGLAAAAAVVVLLSM